MNLIATLMLATAFVGGGDDTRLLFFTSDQCPACHSMQPVVKHLQSKGYPIQEINTSQTASWADRFQITQVPTFVLIKGGQELDRVVGQLTAPEMAQLINKANTQQSETRGVSKAGQPPRQSTPLAQSQQLPQNLASANSQAANSQRAAPQHSQQFVSTSAAKTLTPKELAHQATVRLRVEDSRGANHGTGTIIDVHGKEALVLTCGHVFRDSNGQGEVFADIGFPSEPRTVRGKLLKYDAADHDVALVVIELDRPLQAVAVADAAFNPQAGEALFSVGCDRGADPTVRDGKMLRVSSYSNVHKYDVSNRPIDGRSGGGLFSADGKLIGVCNAADVNADEGIYAGLQSIYWQFRQAGLEDVFTVPAAAPKTEPDLNALAAASQQRQPSRAPHAPVRLAEEELAIEDVEQLGAIGDELVPVTRTSNATGGDVEMIVVIRSRDNPAQTRSIVVSHPTGEMLQMFAAEDLKRERTDLNQMADGKLKKPTRRIPPRIADQEMRAQSPR